MPDDDFIKEALARSSPNDQIELALSKFHDGSMTLL